MIKIVFHSFTMGDVDDPEIYAAQPIYEWQQTEHGRWVMDHAHDLTFRCGSKPHTFGYHVTIRGGLEPKHATEYFLRWNNTKS